MCASGRSSRTRRRASPGLSAAVGGDTALMPPCDRAVGAHMNAPPQMPIRRATQADVPRVARLFAAAFLGDPVFDWLTRTGAKRPAALHRFFTWILERRT